jgi:hypothetical protein
MALPPAHVPVTRVCAPALAPSCDQQNHDDSTDVGYDGLSERLTVWNPFQDD